MPVARSFQQSVAPAHPGQVGVPAVFDEQAFDEQAFAAAVDLMASGSVLVLTGAGMSTDSGIPDYRGPGAPVRAPMTITEFKSGPVAQQRYWARSHLGWQRMGTALPNDGHRALAALEHAGFVDTVITQNVDGLHQQAGSAQVVDLHGRIDEVVCLNCRLISSRLELHHRLDALNPGFGRDLALTSAPDGDVEFEDTAGFRVAGCRRCSGVLKPNVVFFGESVAKPLVQQCFSAVDAAKAMLVAGSSLTVMSGLRFVRYARRLGIAIVILNRGTTRGDDVADFKIDAGCTATLQTLCHQLGC